MEKDYLTSAQKAAITRKRHIAARKEKEQDRRRTISALEAILQDSDSSPEAKENALFLLAAVYRPH